MGKRENISIWVNLPFKQMKLTTQTGWEPSEILFFLEEQRNFCLNWCNDDDEYPNHSKKEPLSGCRLHEQGEFDIWRKRFVHSKVWT